MKPHTICHLTSVHRADDIRVFHKECVTLARAGYDVTLLAPGEIEEVRHGVRILPLPRVRGRLQRMTTATWQVYQHALRVGADLYHFHDPELISVGLLLKLHGKRVIYDAHEDLPKQIYNKGYIPSWLRGVVSHTVKIIEQCGVRALDGVVTVTPTIAGRFPPMKTYVVRNFPSLSEFVTSGLPYQQRPPIISYIGHLTAIRGIWESVLAMDLLPGNLGAKLHLGGEFIDASFEEKVCCLPGWRQVTFHGWLNRTGITDLLGQTRIGLIPHHPTPNHKFGYPIKLFEYMATGIPVVVADLPALQELIGDTACGILINPSDTQELANAIQWLLEHPDEAERMGQRGRECILTRYNWEYEKDKLLSGYEQILARN